jgi:hypothetical protein
MVNHPTPNGKYLPEFHDQLAKYPIYPGNIIITPKMTHETSDFFLTHFYPPCLLVTFQPSSAETSVDPQSDSIESVSSSEDAAARGGATETGGRATRGLRCFFLKP